ncbi:MAG: IS1634 family transposase [Candidatus Eisenbacteria bacterium]|nr:IS1634 family transposase [Candidatus Eisenbacteria bacterium]
MSKGQVSIGSDADLGLRSERLGPLPLINHFLARIGLKARLDHFVPTRDRRVRLPYAKALGVLLRSILVEREPIYRQYETVTTFTEEAFGLDATLLRYVGDDAIGRALDRLFDADRAALLTDVVVAATEEFDVVLDELHNDSTTVRFCGQYTQARGRRLRVKRAPLITYGYSKDHRPDLKQLLFILTTSNDGGVPVQFRCEAGNCSDSKTHEESWDALCRATGRRDFLYVADSKLCSRDAMDHIDCRGGRLLTVMPRSRGEDGQFREWIQTHEPSWELVVDRPNPRRRGGPRDRWWVCRYHAPSREGWPIVWVRSALLSLKQEYKRQQRITRTMEELEALNAKLAGPRPRRRSRKELAEHVSDILKARKTTRHIVVKVVQHQEHYFRQAGPGRPGPKTRYVRKTRKSWRLQWHIDEEAIAYDRKSDGMYPLLTNDSTLTNAQVLEAHKHQPTIEKRFEQTKTVFEIAPVLLKNEGRVEALFFVYFLALLVQALIERELRLQMQRHEVERLPLYPEDRTTERPTAEQIFRLFALTQRHVLSHDGQKLRTFEPDLTELQRQVLGLLGVPEKAYVTSR